MGENPMKLAALIAVSCVIPAAAGQTLEATSTWSSGVGSNGHTYHLYSVAGGVDWATAESNAVGLGGTLATITSGEENAFVFTSLNIAGTNSVWYVNEVGS